MSDRFLLTGLPRIRSAWFAALFSALGVETCHDYQTRFESLGALQSWLRRPGLKGWCDPSAACLLPTFASLEFSGHPVVIIERDVAGSRAGLERWAEMPLPEFGNIVASVEQFKQTLTGDVLTVPLAHMDDYSTVARVVRHCADIKLPVRVWQAFDLLRIEQHMPKARALQLAAA